MKYPNLGKNYDQDVSIDRFNLDECIERQPNAVMFYGEAVADIDKEISVLKDQISDRESEVDLSIRSGEIIVVDKDEKPIKVTEGLIKSYSATHENIKQMKLDLYDKLKKRAKLNAAYLAIQGNKKNLEVESNLWIQKYYSNPSVNNKVDAIASTARKHWKKKGEENAEE